VGTFNIIVGERKTLLQEIVDENERWHIENVRGWGTDRLSISIQRWVEGKGVRGQITIHKDQADQFRLTKEAQRMTEWGMMERELKTDYEEERNPYNWRVDERVRYEEKKEEVSELDSARNLIKKWKQEAETEIRATDFVSVLVSDGIVE
jgi:hypothetical protein